ncbi:MAG TPA: hypothetical protein VIH35_00115 [Kiritimatiellia bacterium]
MSPILARESYGLTNTFRLRSAWATVVVAPDAGRIVAMAFDTTDNVLRLDEQLLARAPAGESDSDWHNHGGDWLWPVAQGRWNLLQQGDWPPPALLRNPAWLARAWENVDGGKCCLLSREFGEPLNIRVSRLVRVDPGQARIDIRQRIERIAPSDIPVCLWQISQVAGANRVVLPVETNSAFTGGYRVVAFSEPGAEMTTRADGAVAFDLAQGTEHKVGSDSPRAWIAAQKGDALILAYARGGDAGGEFPDGGCRTTFYANSGLGYTEIETMSVEKKLAPGERLENTVRIELYKVAPDLPAEQLIQKIRQWRGEIMANVTRASSP